MKNSLILAFALNACAPATQIQKHEGFEMPPSHSKVADELEDTRDAIQSRCGLVDGQFSLISVLQGKERGNFFLTGLSAEQKVCAQRVVETRAKNNCEIHAEEKGEKLLVRGICK